MATLLQLLLLIAVHLLFEWMVYIAIFSIASSMKDQPTPDVPHLEYRAAIRISFFSSDDYVWSEANWIELNLARAPFLPLFFGEVNIVLWLVTTPPSNSQLYTL